MWGKSVGMLVGLNLEALKQMLVKALEQENEMFEDIKLKDSFRSQKAKCELFPF